MGYLRVIFVLFCFFTFLNTDIVEEGQTLRETIT